MAFASNVDAARETIRLSGGGSIEAVRITISATDVAAASEVTITWANEDAARWLASASRLYLYELRAALTGGTGTTIATVLGTTTNPTGLNVIASYSAGAINSDASLLTSPPSFAPGSALYLRPTPDAGTDNAVSVQLLVSDVCPL